MNEIEETWSPEPVKAWRYWRVSDLEWNWALDRFEAVLIGDRETWDSPVKFAGQHKEDGAVMRNGDGLAVEIATVDHSSPQIGCNCGVNAVKEVDWADLLRRSRDQWGNGHPICSVAVAPVELAGTVDEYEKGYRAEQATIIGPVRIFNCDQRRADALERVYGLEVLVEDWNSAWCQTLALQSQIRRQQEEEQDGHRKADTSDHRGTGTSQNPGAGKGTSKGWRKVKAGLGFVAAVLCVLSVVVGFGFGLAAIDNAVNGAESDAECVRLAAEFGGTAQSLDTLFDCRIILPNGLILNGDSLYWADAKSALK